MTNNSVVQDVQVSLLDAAKPSSQGVRSLAGLALGAAAAAATEVVMGAVSHALKTGEKQVAQAQPAATKKVKAVVVEAVGPPKKRAVR